MNAGFAGAQTSAAGLIDRRVSKSGPEGQLPLSFSRLRAAAVAVSPTRSPAAAPKEPVQGFAGTKVWAFGDHNLRRSIQAPTASEASSSTNARIV